MKTKTNWSIDNIHSEIGFSVKHLMISNVKGAFKIFNATIVTESKDFTTAEIDLWIDTSSITTGDIKRDDHLRSADFFDVVNYKKITFNSSKIGKSESLGNFEMSGELTIKGITNHVTLNVQFGGIIIDPWGNEKAGLTITGKIIRSEWGLVWNTTMETGGILVGEEVNIFCEVELTNIGEIEVVEESEASTEANSVL